MSVGQLARQVRSWLLTLFWGRLGESGRRLVKFGLVGLTGIAVNSALLALLVEVAHLPTFVAGALATEGAVLSNFTLHDHWTFRDVDTRTSRPTRAMRYNLAALGGLGMTVAVLAVLTGPLHIYYLAANLFAVGTGVAWNYALSLRFAWASPGISRPSDAARSRRPSWSPNYDEPDAAVTVARR